MKNKRKKLALLMSASLTANIISIVSIKVSGTSADELVQKQAQILESALSFLETAKNDDGSFGSYTDIINETAETALVLRKHGGYDISSSVSWLKNNGYNENTDTLSRTAAASGDTSILDSVISYANSDGGFGLYKDSASNVLDSVLVLDAINACDSSLYTESGTALCLYLAGNLNNDGGWSYSSSSESDVILTAMVSYSIDKFLDDNMLTSELTENALSQSNDFLKEHVSLSFDSNNLEETLYANIAYKQYEGTIEYTEILNGLKSVQSSNGSFYNDVHLTSLAVRLLDDIDFANSVHIYDMDTSLSTYDAYLGKDEEVSVQYAVSYKADIEEEYTLRTTVTNGDTVIYTEEIPVSFSSYENIVGGTAAEFVLNEMRDDGIVVLTELYRGNDVVKSAEKTITMHEVPVAGSTELTDFTLDLSQYFTYTDIPVEVSADFKLLFATNVENSVDMHFTVAKGEEIISENSLEVPLIPSENSVKEQGISFTPDVSDEGVYTVTAQCLYQGDVVAERIAEFQVIKQVQLEELPEPSEGEEEPKSEIVVTWAGPVLSDYVVYSGAETAIDANAEILYYSNGDFNGIVSMQVLDGDEIIAEREEEITLEKAMPTYQGGNAILPIFDTEDFLNFKVKEKGTIAVQVKFCDLEGNILGENTRYVNIVEKPVQDLILNSNVDNNIVKLSWNDITNDTEEYSYRLYRRTEGNDWETRSIWNESEKVRVLNVYPASPYLEGWMTTTISDSEEPAGMGLFDIDSVHIRTFNSDPETYMIGESGEWLYDVIFFGSSDCNSNYDLSDAAYPYVQSFADSGRGVLFGHDTICVNFGHNNFCKFADQLGILVKRDTTVMATSSVSVVNIGTLTNFPWTIRGTLNIPSCHSYGQYVGGTLTATEWMTLNTTQLTDSETGGHSNFYLVTKGNLGMIQTGHSNGSATDDERKVLANTLFYLHQSSKLTTANDNSFYDVDAPDTPDVTAGEISKGSIPLSLSTKDNPTVYEYYISADPVSEDGDTVCSNTITETAFADLNGYVIGINDSSEPSPELIEYDETNEFVQNIRKADSNGKLNTSIEIPDYGKQYYIHVFAVDNANNVSEEVIIPVGAAKINTKVITDKDIYNPGETVNVSSESKAVMFGVTADVNLSIYDENGNLTLCIADEAMQELLPDNSLNLEGQWTVPKVLAGKYSAKITWSINEEIIASASYEFRIAANGSLNNAVHTDKRTYYSSEPVEIINSVKNSSTNSAEKNLVLNIDVYNAQSRKAASFSSEIGTLYPSSDYFYNDIVRPGNLSAGDYTVYAVVEDENGTVSEASTEFEVIETSAVMTGKLSFTPNGDYAQTADFSVINNSDSDISNALIRVKIYPANSDECVGTIVRYADIKAGETVEFSDVIDTTSYSLGDYVGILTVETENDSAELDTDTFIVDKEYIAPVTTTSTAESTTTTTTTNAKNTTTVSNSDSPKTGDNVPVILWVMTFISAAGLAASILMGVKKDEKNN